MGSLKKEHGEYVVEEGAVNMGGYLPVVPRDIMGSHDDFELDDDFTRSMKTLIAGQIEEAYMSGVIACLANLNIWVSEEGLSVSSPTTNVDQEWLRLKSPYLRLHDDRLPRGENGDRQEVATARLIVTMTDGAQVAFPVKVEVFS